MEAQSLLYRRSTPTGHGRLSRPECSKRMKKGFSRDLVKVFQRMRTRFEHLDNRETGRIKRSVGRLGVVTCVVRKVILLETAKREHFANRQAHMLENGLMTMLQIKRIVNDSTVLTTSSGVLTKTVVFGDSRTVVTELQGDAVLRTKVRRSSDVFEHTKKRKKIDSKSMEGIAIGCFENIQYSVWLKDSRSVVVNRDLMIDEQSFPVFNWFKQEEEVLEEVDEGQENDDSGTAADGERKDNDESNKEHGIEDGTQDYLAISE
ncbi:hypothetical protein BWQ96_04359 [Gracilariopsis chorda]|uniref:Retroviral polymerase SH3-like domain-containing protein n=1 Tax=Gracilariopsis chorda TaxID=448386 RepID=A0A2V3IE92_9FLOR|nr:hypothetical protein BWQ96_09927 [Gracilariopsis chorda]PXF45924.1 hypothetical protein BWQ96_04359 [Gracilariopsis chorda]|eukprot:PXF40371.1 hypothetical protein BWQ96_09927 [Gracilariopsis chorda]